MDRSWDDLGIDIPAGRTGNVKALCPKCSTNRRNENLREKCLSVDVDRGLFRCHNCGWKGSLRMGGESGIVRSRPQRIYARPVVTIQPTLTEKAKTFFTDRGINPDLLTKYDITGDDHAVKFPYYSGGELVNVKTRVLPKKPMFLEKDCELILWGLDECVNAEQVIIVEGELDRLACETAGLPHVLSVPNGSETGAMNYLVSGEHIFANCHTVILAGDSDEPGQKLVNELARRIGQERCWRVTWPEDCKDANDVLIKHGEAVLRMAIAEMKPYPIPGVQTASDFLDQAEDFYTHGRQAGEQTGWSALRNLYTVKESELTVVTGIPGSGKSEFLDALALNLTASNDWCFGMFSAEDGGSLDHFSRLAEKYYQKPFRDGPTPPMTVAEFKEFLAWVDERIQFIVPDSPDLDTILELARLLVFRLGIKGLILDPWNQLEHTRPSGLNETEYVSACLGEIKRFATKNGVHVWVTAHPRKPVEKDGVIFVPTPYDISGSANWYNKADNCLTISRDKEQESDPVNIFVQKIRFREVGRIGKGQLNYDRVTGCYRDVRANFS